MSEASRQLAGLLFIIIPTIAFGGYSLLRFMTKRDPSYMENPTRRAMFVAGHAHAGVLVMLALVALTYVDSADLSSGFKAVARNGIALAPLLMSAGFFLSIAPPKATKPNGLVALVYIGALSLVVGTVTLGVGLIRAA